MQAVKDAAAKITNRDGKHDTTVHERVAPAVQNETVHEAQHQQHHPVVDREVHQDHHHTSVQPIHHKETLPEQHHHRQLATEHTTHDHRNDSDTKQRLATEAAQFKDTSRRVEGETTSSVAPAVTGEHVHHHVHENIQPVVHKQTVEPHVVHTTAPVHETHHNAAKHHAGSTLPAMSMDEFQKAGGQLGGRGERKDMFDGCPTGAHQGSGISGVAGDHSHSHNHGTTGTSGIGSIGTSGIGSTGTSGVGSTGTSGVGSTGVGHSSTSQGALAGAQGAAGSAGAVGSTGAAGTHQKPSLMDKLNPSKDADGDGKKGFMK